MVSALLSGRWYDYIFVRSLNRTSGIRRTTSRPPPLPRCFFLSREPEPYRDGNNCAIYRRRKLPPKIESRERYRRSYRPRILSTLRGNVSLSRPCSVIPFTTEMRKSLFSLRRDKPNFIGNHVRCKFRAREIITSLEVAAVRPLNRSTSEFRPLSCGQNLIVIELQFSRRS